jgi:hypothetical protein
MTGTAITIANIKIRAQMLKWLGVRLAIPRRFKRSGGTRVCAISLPHIVNQLQDCFRIVVECREG